MPWSSTARAGHRPPRSRRSTHWEDGLRSRAIVVGFPFPKGKLDSVLHDEAASATLAALGSSAPAAPPLRPYGCPRRRVRAVSSAEQASTSHSQSAHPTERL